MQTPAGYAIIDGRVVPTDWLAVIFNPSFPYRLVHMVLAAFISTALMVAASAAWHLLRGRDSQRGDAGRVEALVDPGRDVRRTDLDLVRQCGDAAVAHVKCFLAMGCRARRWSIPGRCAR